MITSDYDGLEALSLPMEFHSLPVIGTGPQGEPIARVVNDGHDLGRLWGVFCAA